MTSQAQHSIRPTAQASRVTFELHTLGWEAFQNLCNHIIREVFGQTATIFSPSNDAGQDGAFQGVWQKSKMETFEGRFVVQCKFTSRREGAISLGDLSDELEKTKKLAANGLAVTYLLMTNAKISGESDKAIRTEFLKIPGLKHFDIFGVEWITEQIRVSKRLRAYVPRVYGLGDLSQILDERAYRQCDEIIQTWKDNLSKFVATEAHKKSVNALLEHGFVLLLGDPMAGKSTIAAALALAAADQWNCTPVFITSPSDLKLHWNPDEPRQFFWVDDAFGQTQYDPALAAGWNRVFLHLAAAIRRGARVIFTSRTYIYNAAKEDLKEAAFPLLVESSVVIEVENLSLKEKEKILYNHVRIGRQNKEFKTLIKPFLPDVAANRRFFPEVARRLADPFFTKDLVFSQDFLRRFVEEPKSFLTDVIRQLGKMSFAVLALLFMRGGKVAIPLKLESTEVEAMSLLGANLSQMRDAFLAQEGSLISQSFESGEHFWRFRHPSIRDSMAGLIASQPDLIDIYLSGVKAGELIREVVCGDVKVAGAKVQVPSSRFDKVISIVKGIELDNWYAKYTILPFFAKRCSSEFLSIWIKDCHSDFVRLFRISRVTDADFCLLIARLNRLGALADEYRAEYIKQGTNELLGSGEMTFLEEDVRDVLLADEYLSVLEKIKSKFPGELDGIVMSIEDGYYDYDEDPRDHFSDFLNNVENVWGLFDEGELDDAFNDAEDLVKDAVKRLEEKRFERAEEERVQKEMEEDEAQHYRALAEEAKQFDRVVSDCGDAPRKALFDGEFPVRSVFDDVDA